MLIDIKAVEEVYRKMSSGVAAAQKLTKRPLTLTEKVLYGHLFDPVPGKVYERGADYVNFLPDRVAMQDATAQMALLQFMTAGRKSTAIPATVHCDHLILAKTGVRKDTCRLPFAKRRGIFLPADGKRKIRHRILEAGSWHYPPGHH